MQLSAPEPDHGLVQADELGRPGWAGRGGENGGQREVLVVDAATGEKALGGGGVHAAGSADGHLTSFGADAAPGVTPARRESCEPWSSTAASRRRPRCAATRTAPARFPSTR